MRYRLRLSIRYRFAQPAGGARQLLRICPAELPGQQQVQGCEVTVTPRPDEQRSFTDFFGTHVTEILLPDGGISDLRFDMLAMVNRTAQPPSGLDLSPSLAEMAAALSRVRDLGPASPQHFRFPSPHIPHVPAIEAFVRKVVGPDQQALAVIAAVGQALHDGLRFDSSATEVDTPIAEAFEGRHGVCQDFSQIMISGLRAVGVPAAYVTGFLRTLPPPGKPRLQGADAMHAWVRAWAGPQTGWVEYDPTNGCFVGPDHVVVGYGRDYGDAAPVTGRIWLSGAQTGTHSVDIEEIPAIAAWD